VQDLGLTKVFSMKKILLCVFTLSQFLMAQQVKFLRTYGFGIFDSGEGVIQANDTGYVVGGITSQSGANGTDVLIYKTDSLGILEWYKPIGLNNSIEGARSLAAGRGKTEYVLAGYQNTYDTSGYNFYVVKTDLNGDTLWTRAYGGPDWDMAYSVDTLQDSTYVIAGETFSYGNGNTDMYVIRIDSNGDTLWTRTFGGTEDDYARYVYADRHNNIVVIGSTTSFGAGGSDVYVVCLNPLGDTLWTRTYGSAEDEYGYSGDMYIDNGGNMSYAYAYTQYNPISSVQETRFFRTDSMGAVIYYVSFWFESQSEMLDHPRMRMDGKGRFYLGGDMRYTDEGLTDVYLHRTNYGIGFSGVFAYIDFDLPTTPPTPPGSEYPHDIRKCYDKGLVVTGSTTTVGPGPTSSFIMKTDTILSSPSEPVVAVEDYEALDFSVYPIPVADHIIYIQSAFPIQQIRLFDLNGRMVQIIQGENYTTQSAMLGEMASGMYILEVVTAQGSGRKKIWVQ
jgi:hypothetical protein